MPLDLSLEGEQGLNVMYLIHKGSLNSPPGLAATADATGLRAVPMVTGLRAEGGALDDAVELADEGLFPSTESSSSKFLSEIKNKICW